MSLVLAVLLSQAVPGAVWDEKSPAAAGLSREKLEALRDLAGGRGCVVRGGVLVYSWGDVSTSGDVARAADPVLSWLLMAAVQEGRLPGLDARMSDLESRLTGKNSAITWRQLAGQVSGYGLEERPGEAWAANDDAVDLFGGTLMGKVFGHAGTDVLDRTLRRPLQFQDPCRWVASGEEARPGRLEISVRDFARFGLLVLRGGSWGTMRVLAPGLSYLFISAPVPADLPRASGRIGPLLPGQRRLPDGRSPAGVGPGCRSFLWWVNGIDAERRQLFVDGPGDLVAALGQGGRRALWILPSLDLVACWNDAAIDDLDRSPGRADARINQAVRLLVQSAAP
ncbi:MAG TPA: hypothetical protein VKW04_09040 [Planctomycetota bacterium]|nr:hypothetical protein [Planctomycetota bacterium]